MKRVRSKKSFSQIILLIGFGFVFFNFIGCVLTFQFIRDHSDIKKSMLIFIALGAFGFAEYSLYYFLTRFPSITIDERAITISTVFGKTIVDFEDIKFINLMKKSPMSFLWITMPIESTSLMTKDLQEIVIWDDYYRNISEVKLRLEQIKVGIQTGNFNNKIANDTNNSLIDLRLEIFDEIKGNGLVNINALMVLGFLTFWIFIMGMKILLSVKGLLISMILFCAVYGFYGYQLNYYLISENYFQVRNHLLFFKRKTYRLIDIKEIIFEEPHRLSKSVRIRTTDFKTTLHPGGSLRDRHWLELKNKLESKDIEVRDELLHY